jgi:hypothetical protein
LAADVWQVILMQFLGATRLFWVEMGAELHLFWGEMAAEFQRNGSRVPTKSRGLPAKWGAVSNGDYWCSRWGSRDSFLCASPWGRLAKF